MLKGEALSPFVDIDDIADAIVEPFLDNRNSKQVYELTGLYWLTFEKGYFRDFKRFTGRNIWFHSIKMNE